MPINTRLMNSTRGVCRGNLCTLHLLPSQVRAGPLLADCMHLAFTRIPGEQYRQRFRSVVVFTDIFRALTLFADAYSETRTQTLRASFCFRSKFQCSFRKEVKKNCSWCRRSPIHRQHGTASTRWGASGRKVGSGLGSSIRPAHARFYTPHQIYIHNHVLVQLSGMQQNSTQKPRDWDFPRKQHSDLAVQ